MRLWHKTLVPLLPRQQLLGQWREICLIAKSLSEKGTPNHLLVNKVLDYPAGHFDSYARLVHDEMIKRGYKCNWQCYVRFRADADTGVVIDEIFKDWHNERYLRQCYYNLEEKYDCGGISEEEWMLLRNII